MDFGGLSVGVSCHDTLAEGFQAAHLRLDPAAGVISGPAFPERPPVVSRRAQGVVAGACSRAVCFPETSVLSDRDDRNGVAFDDGLVAAACVVGAVGGDRAYLLTCRDLAEQVGQHGAVRTAIRDLDGQGLLPAAQRGKVRHGPVQAGQSQQAGHHSGGLAQRQLEQDFDR